MPDHIFASNHIFENPWTGFLARAFAWDQAKPSAEVSVRYGVVYATAHGPDLRLRFEHNKACSDDSCIATERRTAWGLDRIVATGYLPKLNTAPLASL